VSSASSALDAFFATHDWPKILTATGWGVQRDPEDPARIFFETKARDGESYRLLFLCDSYPTTAPSVAFVNAAGSKSDPLAWPRGDGTFFEEVKPPPNSFLCMPLTREGLAHHPDWLLSPTARPWRADAHTLMDLFNHVQRLLNSEHYQGRGS
jgi:hypothetical protein